MAYLMPNYPSEFEIPDAWLNEAVMDGFARTTPTYLSRPGRRLCRFVRSSRHIAHLHTRKIGAALTALG
jgi:hypothetical protein